MGEYAVKNEFLVMPADTNDLYPLIFGRQLWGEMDKAAAIVSRKYLEDTGCKYAVTHHAEVTFKMPSYSGDILTIDADVESANERSIVVDIAVWRGQDKIADAKFVFVAITDVETIKDRPKYLQYARHCKPFKKD